MNDSGGRPPAPKSAIADEISDLMKSVRRVSNERERLPQPLFWSLFHSRLAGIRKHKEIERAISAALGEEK